MKPQVSWNLLYWPDHPQTHGDLPAFNNFIELSPATSEHVTTVLQSAEQDELFVKFRARKLGLTLCSARIPDNSKIWRYCTKLFKMISFHIMSMGFSYCHFCFVFKVIYIWMGVLPACISVYDVHAWGPWRPEEGAGCPGTKVIDSWELPYSCWK